MSTSFDPEAYLGRNSPDPANDPAPTFDVGGLAWTTVRLVSGSPVEFTASACDALWRVKLKAGVVTLRLETSVLSESGQRRIPLNIKVGGFDEAPEADLFEAAMTKAGDSSTQKQIDRHVDVELANLGSRLEPYYEAVEA